MPNPTAIVALKKVAHVEILVQLALLIDDPLTKQNIQEPEMKELKEKKKNNPSVDDLPGSNLQINTTSLSIF